MADTKAKTWGELQAEGVKRCCAVFTTGKRCRRRATAKFEGVWCDKHGVVIKAASDHANWAMHQEATRDDQEQDDEQ